jgi:hypothetical protein
MRRLTSILLLAPVALALLAPSAMFASMEACCEHRAAGHDCPHPQDESPKSKPGPSDCHRCCITMAAGFATPALILETSLVEREFLVVTPQTLAPAAPVAAAIFERGPPSA